MRSAILSSLAMAGYASAHAQVYGVWVNGEDQGDGRDVYIRSPNDNGPVKDLESPDIVCNVNGGKAVSDFVSVAAGDTFSFEWYHDNRGDDIIDGSHQGPIVTWIAEYTEDAGTGAIWTKIDEDGYDGSTWAVQKLIDNAGLYDLTIPESLAAGKYIIRQEIIAHHESDTAYSENEARGAQFYPSCVQVEVTGSGSAVPDQGFDFNTGYTYDDEGIVFNLYNDDASSYTIPGPEVWSAGSGGSSPAPDASSPAEESSAAETDAAEETSAEASSPAETGAAEETPAASSTDAADPAATSSPSEIEVPGENAEAPATTEAASTPAADAPTTIVTSTKPSSTAEDEEAAPSPTKVPCTKRRRRSMKKRAAVTY